MKAVASVLVVILAVGGVAQANTILIDFAGATYGPPILADGVGADPPAALNYNVYDPPATQGDGTFRFQAAAAGFLPAGTQVNMIADLKDTGGSLAGIGLDGIYNAGSAGIARDTYTGAPVGVFAPEALQDMIFLSANNSNAFTFVLTNLATDGTTYSLTFASARDAGFDGRAYYTIGGNTQFVELTTTRAGTVTFNDLLPDANAEIRIDVGDRDPVTGVDHGTAWIAAMSVDVTPIPEPGSIILITIGMIGLACCARNRLLRAA